MTSLRWVRPWGEEHLAKNTNSRQSSRSLKKAGESPKYHQTLVSLNKPCIDG